jgi:transcriptional regulator with PAS, ATPase and Fis domain
VRGNFETTSIIRDHFYYRVSVIPLRVPPLRERSEGYRASCPTVQMGKSVRGIDDKAQTALARYAWPDNGHELENVIERAVAITSPTDCSIGLSQLPDYVGGLSPPETEPVHIPKEGFNLELQMASIEKRYLREALYRRRCQ